ncbi:unnamed protein product, partial [marine sediment metagenome]
CCYRWYLQTDVSRFLIKFRERKNKGRIKFEFKVGDKVF